MLRRWRWISQRTFSKWRGESRRPGDRTEAADAPPVRAIRRQRLTAGTEVIMEACGTAHYWGRRCQARDLRVRLLPVQYVRPYVRRNKTDRTDTEAMLEAARCGGIRPVPVKTVEQQTLQALHRVRTQWQAARTARINVVRGLLREQGLPVPVGARTVLARVAGDPRGRRRSRSPICCATPSGSCVDEIRALEARIATIDQQLAQVAADASGRAAAPADSGRRRADRDGAGRRGQSHPRLSARARVRELAGVDAARVVDGRSPLSRPHQQTRRRVPALFTDARGPRRPARRRNAPRAPRRSG